ncbi:hypothetical protein [Legionella gresilensis]|uniref:hypothetical protein n=1 Tax=Legionella gresilensis TaxID=91823 RepID=UPI0010416AF4|nr:hypothetical protein [Legionella gresilensis]
MLSIIKKVDLTPKDPSHIPIMITLLADLKTKNAQIEHIKEEKKIIENQQQLIKRAKTILTNALTSIETKYQPLDVYLAQLRDLLYLVDDNKNFIPPFDEIQAALERLITTYKEQDLNSDDKIPAQPGPRQYKKILEDVLKIIKEADFTAQTPNHIPILAKYLEDLEKKIISDKDLAKYEEQKREQETRSDLMFKQSQINARELEILRDSANASKKKTLMANLQTLESIAEPKKQRSLYAKTPKLLVFDVDDTLVDLEKPGALKRQEELVTIINYAKKLGIDVAIATNRGQSAEDNRFVEDVKTLIREKTGIDIPIMLTFKDFDSITSEVKEFRDEISKRLEQIKIAKQKAIFEGKKEILEKLEKAEEKLRQRENRLLSGKNLKLDEIRLHYQAFKNYAIGVLQEDEVVFVDDNPHIIKSALEETNYRAIKASARGENSFKYLVDINYELGAYNVCISFLKEDGRYPQDKDYPLSHYLTDSNIPNFSKHGFAHTPIVKHVEMSTILSKLDSFSKNPDKQALYKRQFLESAIERYEELPKELQNDFVRTYYLDAYGVLNKANETLIEIYKISNDVNNLEKHIKSQTQPTQEELNQLENKKRLQEDALTKLNDLKIQMDKIIAMDDKFSQKISPTFLSCEAMLLKSRITSYKESGNFEFLKVDQSTQEEQLEQEEKKEIQEEKEIKKEQEKNSKVRKSHDETRTKFYIEATEKKPEVYLREETKEIPAIHPILKEIPEFDKDFISSQYESYIFKNLTEIIEKYCTKEHFSLLTIINYDDKNLLLQNLLTSLEQQLKIIVSNTDKQPLTSYNQLSEAKELCEALESIAPYQTWLDNFREQPKKDYKRQISNLSEKITRNQDKIKSSEEYKAKLYLDKAKQYLLHKDWNVGYQREAHTEVVDGKVKKFPATIAEQLKFIKQAEAGTISFAKAKTEYLELGRKKEITWRSSKPAKNYYSLFTAKKEHNELAKALEKEFDKDKKMV